MKRTAIIATALVGVSILLYFYLRDSRDRRLLERGDLIITQIEDFKVRERRLPNSLEEVEHC
jgi:hypothetical protein